MALQAKTEQVAKTWNPELFESVPGWQGPLRHADIWHPDYSKPDIDLSGVYVSENLQQVQLQITGYRIQTQDKELIFYGNTLFDSERWRLLAQSKHPLESAYASDLELVNETIIQQKENGERIIVWSWYSIGETLTDSRIKAKVKGALNKITGDSRGALWALAGRCADGDIDDCDQQRVAFREFLESSRR